MRKTLATSMSLKGNHPPRRRRRVRMPTIGNHPFAMVSNLLKGTFKIVVPDTASLDDIPNILTSLLHSSDGRRVTFQIASVRRAALGKQRHARKFGGSGRLHSVPDMRGELL